MTLMSARTETPGFECDTCGVAAIVGTGLSRRGFTDFTGYACATSGCKGLMVRSESKPKPMFASGRRSPHQEVMLDLPADSAGRKAVPVTTGVLDYFPAAIAAVARVSQAGNDQHNSGEPLHWARGKSRDHADCIVRHLMQRGTIDTDGQRHSAKVAWRALALLQEELEAEAGFTPEES